MLLIGFPAPRKVQSEAAKRRVRMGRDWCREGSSKHRPSLHPLVPTDHKIYMNWNKNRNISPIPSIPACTQSSELMCINKGHLQAILGGKFRAKGTSCTQTSPTAPAQVTLALTLSIPGFSLAADGWQAVPSPASVPALRRSKHSNGALRRLRLGINFLISSP